MNLDHVNRIYANEITRELVAAIKSSFSTRHLQATEEIGIVDGGLAENIPKYEYATIAANLADFVSTSFVSDSLLAEIRKVEQDETLSDQEIENISKAMCEVVFTSEGKNLIRHICLLLMAAASEGFAQGVHDLVKTKETIAFENELLLSMKYTDEMAIMNMGNWNITVLFTVLFLKSDNAVNEDFFAYHMQYADFVRDYVYAFICREYECEIRAKHEIEETNREMKPKNANEIAEKGYANYQNHKAKEELASKLFEDCKQKQEKVFGEFIKITLSRYERLLSYADEKKKEMDSQSDNIAFAEDKRDMAMAFFSDYKNSFVAGGLMLGTGLVAATVGGFTLFGTASTGAAIMGLHGAAYVGSLLSAIGGGALAAGGLGIAGGAAILGGVFMVPFVAFVATKISRQKAENEEEGKRFYRRCMREAERLKQRCNEYMAIAMDMQCVTFEIENLRLLLEGIMDVLEQTLLEEETPEVLSLKEKMNSVIEQVFSIHYTDQYGNYNESAKNEIQNLHLEVASLQRIFGSYVSGLEKTWHKKWLDSKNNAKDLHRTNYKVNALENEQLREMLLNSFSNAKKEICIISPWISGWVMDSFMDAMMCGAMKRGVTIKILYGIGDLKGSNTNKDRDKKRTESTEEFARRLQNKYKNYGSRFVMKRDNTHAKLLICDDAYYIIGSYNFLSFDGNYSNADVRHEMGDYSENQEQIEYYKKRYFDF